MLARLAGSMLAFIKSRVVVEYADGRVQIEISEEDWHGLLETLGFIAREANIKAPEVIVRYIEVLERVVQEDS